ncbi:MAG: BlaI/MecI/CopY family transcriptional regulator [Candidatus Hydrogenedentes bacterium]|nr:BlaI/MecI/CopY family transcriptional regulator [Candidatus Hydrogenedentota bacterium]
MARRKSKTLTELELEIMNVLWRKGRATVQEIRDIMADHRPLAYTSISTMMGILEKKGYVAHDTQGRSYVYRPTVERVKAQRSLVQNFLARVFHGSPALLMLNLIANEEISPSELDHVQRAIDRRKKEIVNNDGSESS